MQSKLLNCSCNASCFKLNRSINKVKNKTQFVTRMVRNIIFLVTAWTSSLWCLQYPVNIISLDYCTEIIWCKLQLFCTDCHCFWIDCIQQDKVNCNKYPPQISLASKQSSLPTQHHVQAELQRHQCVHSHTRMSKQCHQTECGREC